MRFDRLVRFFSFTEAADSVVRKALDFQWFLTVIAGYIRSHGGGYLAFITCTPRNAHLYSSAGYRIVGEHSVSLDDNDVHVWSFEKVIE